MKKLTTKEIEERLANLIDWEYEDDALVTDFEFDNFKDCMSAMNRIAFECEALHHHPEWTNIYNMLEIKLTTHDACGVTDLDFQLATAINKIVEVEEIDDDEEYED
ncbi:MAG: 4a-hydroxytetrahydrobiopterin dehydratase [Flavobacteriia bacterium]|nr:4a-hydroxytetrahydrobiopterin dehydratase [Flavobacteriia bacterium]OIP45084.1 MAG: 4a-hydroxytetrahydrobiopterin dehydratase [Flavobacteriaceae bacterium CG2_30_31_66]PIV95279.1 MAG: 4a-hydroxytetrahydrobiopterin dehydratase [Flavobacteriaceae bacterium CG17_big_fil_post_rev_8_21_14_2_50_31_13]PIY13610.1 MAG: 4a-hydroxytetrahydrobiopterin dehydratase [Flavobacteriaceae bacterium CG_4_10_14_3_um_filter_31_253]PIZ11829.1 MAG: 4a-hydroxytetrahydrobiopterin dehydratase [Flavobacteriaceae bacter